jgi:hypothetical protein
MRRAANGPCQTEVRAGGGVVELTEWERQQLAGIEDGLRRSDPAMARRLGIRRGWWLLKAARWRLSVAAGLGAIACVLGLIERVSALFEAGAVLVGMTACAAMLLIFWSAQR